MIYLYKQYMDTGVTIFDRGIPNIIAYSQCFSLEIGAERKAGEIYRYAKTIFLAPCWEDIFENDADRQLSFDQAKVFEDDLSQAYIALGYNILELPRDSIEVRKRFVLEMVG